MRAASDPAALVWNADPGGPSESAIYRGEDNHIYVLSYSKASDGWTPTDATLATKDGSTPTGNPHAFVWTSASDTSFHIAFRGAEGEIHELRKTGAAWQPADDPSWDAHATARNQLAAGDPVGFAWERATATQTIHWFFRTGDGGNLAELWRSDSAANAWSFNNLSVTASGSGKPAPVATMLPGYVWKFDPVLGSSIHVFYAGTDQHVYEMWYDVPNPSQPTEGHWVWTDLTNQATNAAGQTAPLAVSS